MGTNRDAHKSNKMRSKRKCNSKTEYKTTKQTKLNQPRTAKRGHGTENRGHKDANPNANRIKKRKDLFNIQT